MPGVTALWHGGACFVPKEVAVCPECGSELSARSLACDTLSGQPEAASIEIECLYDISEVYDEFGHAWRQSDWQDVRDEIARWCNAR